MINNILNSTIFVLARFKGYLFRILAKQILAVGLITLGLVLIHKYTSVKFSDSLSLPGLLGAALGVLLVFRNNTAYDRWWEARKVLGALVNTSRNFALQTHSLIIDSDDKKSLSNLIQAFPFALKEHLRDGVLMEEIAFTKKEDFELINSKKHKPASIVNLMVAYLTKFKNNKLLSEMEYFQLVTRTNELIDILGKCERIKNTPMPDAHTYLLKVYLFAYAITMPFGFIATLGYWSILAVILIYYVSMSIVIISEEIEEPFGKDPNDLPVDAIAKNIKKNVIEIFSTSHEKSILS